MCRFKEDLAFNLISLSLFQYIICVGSSSVFSLVILQLYQFQYIICVGSSSHTRYQVALKLLFQYIICVGSSIKGWLRRTHNVGFNTSYVSVQDFGNGKSLRGVVVSIHHMCRFKALINLVNRLSTVFQYIICVGSRH